MERPGEKSSTLSWFQRLFGIKPPKPEPKSTPSPRPKSHSGFDTTYARQNQTMLRQLRETSKYRLVIEEAARKFAFQPSIICGIGSRESHWGLGLTPPGPGGRGDFAQRRPRGERYSSEPPDGPGYGRGIMQIDYDWHEFARTGDWHDPRENVFYACVVLDRARKFFQRRNVNLSESDMLRAMLAAYNGGATATLRAIESGLDIDANTTGRDYSRDALSRSGWFQLHGWH